MPEEEKCAISESKPNRVFPVPKTTSHTWVPVWSVRLLCLRLSTYIPQQLSFFSPAKRTGARNHQNKNSKQWCQWPFKVNRPSIYLASEYWVTTSSACCVWCPWLTMKLYSQYQLLFWLTNFEIYGIIAQLSNMMLVALSNQQNIVLESESVEEELVV